jgi:hypothetical protein
MAKGRTTCIGPERILLRGFTKEDGDQWVAICIDLDIAAQADTMKQATDRCIELCTEYLQYVCKNYAERIEQFVPRFAPESIRQEYYRLLARSLAPRAKKVHSAAPFTFNIAPPLLGQSRR